MKNTVLNYETETVFLKEADQIGYKIQNYFSKSVNISDLAKSYDDWEDYFDTYKMMDNDKLERVSYELYGTTDYWDILFLINERDPLYDMPYDYDTLVTGTTSFLDTYAYFMYSQAPLSGTRYSELKDEYLEKSQENNEIFRELKIVKSSKISAFISLLKSEKII